MMHDHHDHEQQNGKSDPTKEAFRETLVSLGLPTGLLSSVLQSYNSNDSRLWLIDNSSSMKVHDSHVGGGKTTCSDGNVIIEKVDNVTRWEELQETVAFHSRMASKCWIPTTFWLVNRDESVGENKHKFALCWGAQEDVPTEMERVGRVMDHMALDQARCPLAVCVRSLAKGLAKEAPSLVARDHHVTLVICTQGLPTDGEGRTSSAIVRDFVNELSSLEKLPVKIVVRLCTDNEKVRDMFNTLDSKFDSIDVLDDFWGESLEVYLHNPWLTYSIGLHRLREAGFAPQIMDYIDERPLKLDELHQLCEMLFLGEDGGTTNLPHPKTNWHNFMRALAVLIEKEKTQWNPVKRCTMPWVNLKKLDAMHNPKKKHNGHKSHPSAKQQQTHNHSKENQQSRNDHTQPHTSPQQQKPSDHPAVVRNATTSMTLTEVLRHWSHEPPRYKSFRPLQDLLVTVPQTFPPANAKVEEHEYFAKWKAFDKEAFADESGDELKELLKRAVRKAKFFLHPDKLPKDLTDDQTLLFKTIWEVLLEREALTLG